MLFFRPVTPQSENTHYGVLNDSQEFPLSVAKEPYVPL